MKLKDVQDRKPEVAENLSKVGVTNLKTIVRTRWRGREYRFTPEIELTIDLKSSRKGVHMSRLIEAIAETIEEETVGVHKSLEELGKHILERLKEKHPHRKSEIQFKTELTVERKTPVSGRKTLETHSVAVKVSCGSNGKCFKTLAVEVLGNTVCPHSMEYANGRAHMQRAIGFLELETDYGSDVALEDMIDCVEGSFSSRVYTLLKTEDEAYLVSEMYAHPKFVEDVCREIISKAKTRFRKSWIKAKVVSHESIHRHNVTAEASCHTR